MSLSVYEHFLPYPLPCLSACLSVSLSPCLCFSLSHTPSIIFRHPPPKEGCRKPMLGVCLCPCLCLCLSLSVCLSLSLFHCTYVVVGLFSVSLSVSENFLPVPPSVCLSVWMCLSPLTLPLFIYNHWQRDSPCLCYQHDDVAFPPMFISNNKPCNQLNKTRASCTQ